MKTRQSKRLHNQNVGTTKPEHLHNKEESTMSKYLYYAGYVILAALTLFFCWMFCLKWGVFGAKVDWISQHSVIPDYFRKQFYATGKSVPRICHEPGRRTEHIQLFILWTLQSVIFVVLRIAFCENVYVCYCYGNAMLDGFGAFIVSVAESKRIWQSCQLRCGCYFFADGTYDLPVLQPDYVR